MLTTRTPTRNASAPTGESLCDGLTAELLLAPTVTGAEAVTAETTEKRSSNIREQICPQYNGRHDGVRGSAAYRESTGSHGCGTRNVSLLLIASH
jgi:hypothetical protein